MENIIVRKDDGLKEKVVSPPVKVLKQARLPFAKIQSPAVPEKVVSKKRKLSDDAAVNKLSKQARAVDDATNKLKLPTTGVIVIEDNEVSSSSETENVAHKLEAKSVKPKIGLIDSFVQPVSVIEKSISSTTDDVKLFVVEQNADADSDEEMKEGEECGDEANTSVSTETECPLVISCEGLVSDKGQDIQEVFELKEVSTPSKTSLGSISSPEGSSPKSEKPKKTCTSAKKVALEAEREKKREEKERLKAEKLAQKEAEKLEKEKAKQAEKERKEKEREEAKAAKERERQEKQQKLEQEKQEKMRVKEEERKKREAIQQQKLEEKQKKEAERLEKEEQKRKEEEEKERKKNAQKNALLKFFTKVDTPKSPPKMTQTTGPFMAFEVKKDMVLAPVIRVQRPDCTALDTHLREQNASTLYLDELKSGQHVKRSSKRTLLTEVKSDPEVVVMDDDDRPKTSMKVKFLQFDKSETIRPAYYGTWRKTSRKISPRNPLKKDEDLLDYDVESDEEWEEEEPGESLSNSEGEDEDDPDNAVDDEDDDGFFVPHGYLSDDEVLDEEEELSHEAKKARQIAKAHDWETQMKRKCQAVKAAVIGCLWANEVDPDHMTLWDKLQLYKVAFLENGPVGTTFTASTSDSKTTSQKPKAFKQNLKKGVPEEAMPDLVRLVHGNPHSVAKLMKEFREFWRLKMGGNTLSQATQDQPCGEVRPGDNSQDPNNLGDPNSSVNLNKSMDDSTAAELNTSASSVEDIPKTSTAGSETEAAESPGDEHVISKRQLEMKIKKIAMYERREGLKRAHWYVNQEVLCRYGLTELTVPCTWNYIFIKTDKVNSSKCSTPVSSKTGRVTPSITQFTVEVSPSQIIAQHEAAIAAASQQAAPVLSRSESPSTTTKSSAKLITSFFSKPAHSTKLFDETNRLPPEVITQKPTHIAMDTSSGVGSSQLSAEVEEDDDCMIIE